MATVKLEGVRKSYGAITVIAGLDLTIESGEFVALVGPSGSGKSTLLRMIAGLEKLNSGAILVDGKDVTKADPSDRDMAMVFQSYALYPHMTVAENMTFALRMRKAPQDEIERRLNEALELLALTQFRDRKPGQLSGGQRQRVAMGRAIVRQPAVFLFDEPLSNLDAKLRARTRFELRELHDRLGATSIFVTHDQVEAMTMADRIVLLDQGIVQQVGSPKEIYQYPANRFVAGFIGSPEINILTGTLLLEGDAVTLDEIRLPASQERLALLHRRSLVGRQVEVGIRPEHLTLENGLGQMRLEVEGVEFTGQDVFLIGKAAGARLTLRTDAHNRAVSTESLRRGSFVSLGVIEDQWHVFEPATGRCETTV